MNRSLALLCAVMCCGSASPVRAQVANPFSSFRNSAFKHMNTPQTAGSQFLPAFMQEGLPQGIPCMVEVKGHQDRRSKAGYHQSTEMALHTRAMMYPLIGEEGDYAQACAGNLQGPPPTSFRFEPWAPGGQRVMTGGGTLRDNGASKDTHSAMVAKYRYADFSGVLATTGKGDALCVFGIGCNGPVVGSETITGPNVNQTNPYEQGPGDSYSIMPFAYEAHVGQPQGVPTPVCGMTFSRAAVVNAIRTGATATLSGQESFEFDEEDGDHVRGDVSLRITLWPRPSTLRLEPEDPSAYEAWLPTPADDRNLYGEAKRLRIKAALPDDATASGVIDFYLKEVSKNPGTCTNYPLKGGDDPDLRFPKEQPDGIEWVDDAHVRTTGPVTFATVEVEATDTGAYGTIQAEMAALGMLAVNPATQRTALDIPLDENHNHIADAWEKEKEHQVFGMNLQPTWDEDPKPADQPNHGDGLSVFEEYRGFVVIDEATAGQPGPPKRSFVRTDPLMKDVFVWDRDGLFKKYYMKYNPAGLRFHYVDNTMMNYTAQPDDPDNRWINPNTPKELTEGRQYGMYVLEDDTLKGQVEKDGVKQFDAQGKPIMEPLAGGAQGRPGFQGDQYDDPLRNTYACPINAAATRGQYGSNWKDPAKAAQAQASGENDMYVTLAHEIGHYLGVSHHRTPGAPVTLAADGKAISPENDDTRTHGVVDCAMRYWNQDELDHWGKSYDPVLLRTRYCRRGDPATDAAGKPIPADDCYDKIRVKRKK